MQFWPQEINLRELYQICSPGIAERVQVGIETPDLCIPWRRDVRIHRCKAGRKCGESANAFFCRQLVHCLGHQPATGLKDSSILKDSAQNRMRREETAALGATGYKCYGLTPRQYWEWEKDFDCRDPNEEQENLVGWRQRRLRSRCERSTSIKQRGEQCLYFFFKNWKLDTRTIATKIVDELELE